MSPDGERPAPLILVARPTGGARDGSYASLAREGQRRLAVETSQRLTRLGARVVPLEPVELEPGETFHWGGWFVAGARDAVAARAAEAPPVEAVGYVGAGALALLDDESLAALLTPRRGEAVTNNRFSSDAFVMADGAGELERRLASLEDCPSDNAAPRHLEAAGFAVRDLGEVGFARFDVDTPLDLALLRLAGRLVGMRSLDPGLVAWLESVRVRSGHDLEVPHLERIGEVMRNRAGELVVAGRVPAAVWAHLETETACRVRCLIEERGMRSARGGRPRSILAALLRHTSPRQLVAELAALGDAVILDTRVMMAALAGSADSAAWPPEEDRFASDFGDAEHIQTPWLRELVEAVHDSSEKGVVFLLGGHALISDGLRLLVAAAWEGR